MLKRLVVQIFRDFGSNGGGARRQKAYIIVKYVCSFDGDPTAIVQSGPNQNDGVRVRNNTRTYAPSDAPPPTPEPSHEVTSPLLPPLPPSPSPSPSTANTTTTTTSRPFWTVHVDTRRPTVRTGYSVSASSDRTNSVFRQCIVHTTFSHCLVVRSSVPTRFREFVKNFSEQKTVQVRITGFSTRASLGIGVVRVFPNFKIVVTNIHS